MIKYLILLVFTIVSITLLAFCPPIPQWLSYHQFADTREIGGIPNFWNVVSNAPFILVGILGFTAIRRKWGKGNFVNWREIMPFVAIFTGVILTAIGSAYYHLAPSNETLVWDRMPMTLVFMALVSLTIMERVNFKVGFWLLLPLILLGIWSAWYWLWTESLGRGDLRPYGFVHYYSILLIFLILYLFPKSYPSTKSYLCIFIFFVIATLFELTDIQIYQMGGFVSGHTLKHLSAAIGTYWLVVMVNELEGRTSLNE